MRVLAVLILLAAVVLGQSVEATVFLPESLCGLGWIDYMVWNPANNQVYVANTHAGNVIAISAGTGEKTARIPAGDYGGRLCVSADLNKVYAYDQSRQTLAVIDGNTNTVVKQVYVPVDDGYTVWLAYSPLRQKLYCLSYLGQLAVLDATSDTFKRCLWVYPYNESGGLLYNAAADKLYSPIIAPFDYGVLVIDGARDTTTAVVGVDFSSDDPRMVLNDSSNKVYFESDRDIAVVSGSADTLRAQLVPEVLNAAGICCNPLTNRVYAAYEYIKSVDGPGVLVLDGGADTIITAVALSQTPASVACSPASNRVYVGLYNDSVAVIDGASNQVIQTFYVGHYPSIACYAASNDAVFMSRTIEADLAKVDCPSNSLANVEDLGCEPGAIAYVDEQDRLYVLDEHDGFLNILDGASHKVRRSQYLPSRPANSYVGIGSNLAYGRDLGRMYVAMGDSGLAVFDCATDSLLRVINVPARAVFYDSARCKLYCAGGSSLLVLDAEAETLLTEMPSVTEACAFCLNPVRGLLYVGGAVPYSVTVIDCTADTVVRVLETNSGHTQLEWSQTYDKVYARSDNNGELLIIDCSTNEVLGSFRPRGQWVGGISLNPDGTRLFCPANSSLLIDCATDSVVAELAAMESGQAVWSHDGWRIYVVGWDLGVLVVDAVNSIVVDSIRTGNHPSDVFIHPTVDRVYVANEYGSSLTVIRDEVGIAERPGPDVTTRSLSVLTVVRGVMYMPEATSHKPQAASLLDVAGRRILDLHPGANDVLALAPGVYFVREVSGVKREASRVTKVVVTR